MIIADLFSLDADEVKKIWSKNKQGLMSGKETTKDFIERLRKELNFPRRTEELLSDWLENYKVKARGVDWELMDFIEKLNRKYKVYLLTDTLDIHDNYNKTRNIYSKFHKVFKSYEGGFVKPDKAAFLNFFKKANVRPEECVFVDDLEKNIITAREVGIEGIVYKNTKQMKNELEERIIDMV
ncbi:MAG: HAD-superfamily hydrolase, subfamily IA, variant 3 [Candidatus Gottesmanbacteria bacterium GW2011_GWC2_39_8]|uniref:HAD-superfamily hydrolase, subfamily IA, variant 3 n=1 Tax=Candidatus Gottesmanbacteria bacterium GW2011_GWC2_39_8 TaxID=1618450 RepID=A0A0G0Q1D1_9BACT|nr:MAG: HAD-superfamily hydrolase, subfamily IA, variant 3 [Candidatus Gottesmanbacteria bacterium GW2011_GWC2_39_8]